MRKKMFTGLVILLVSFPMFVYSQNESASGYTLASDDNYKTSGYLDSLAVKILNMTMPSLDVLCNNAVNAPEVKMSEAAEMVRLRDLKSERRQWLTFVKGNANYSYGVNNSLMTFETTGVPVPDQYSNQAQSYYLLGGGIQFSLYDIFNMRNRIKAKEAAYNEQKFATERTYEQMKRLIIEAYFKVQGSLYGLRDAIEYLSMARSSYEGIKVEFVSGHVNQSTLLEEKIRLQRALENYIELVATISRDIYVLESLSNTKILSE